MSDPPYSSNSILCVCVCVDVMWRERVVCVCMGGGALTLPNRPQQLTISQNQHEEKKIEEIHIIVIENTLVREKNSD